MEGFNHSTTIFELALKDFFEGKKDCPKVLIHNRFGEPDEMSPDVYFRDFEEMPEVELFAMELCQGNTLDIGAGVGAHALYMQDLEKEVDALEISKVSSDIMKKRGVRNVLNSDLFHFKPKKKYDTLLMMMNGIGLAESVEGITGLLNQARTLLNPEGFIIFDSSDVAYLWDKKRLSQSPYYGEISYQYQYGDLWGPWFQWLYIDTETMKKQCEKCGWDMLVLYEDETDHYLGRLTRR